MRNFGLFLFCFGLSVSLFAQPTTGPTNFSITNQDGNRIRVNWTRGNGATILVVASLSPTFGGNGTPVNGTDYNEDSQFGFGPTIGAGNFVVYEGTGTNVTVTGLTHSTTYYFRLFEFDGTGLGTLYNTTNVLSGNGTTVSPPTVGSSAMVATPTGNSASLTWTKGNGSRSLVILQTGSIPDNPVDYTNYSSSTTFGSGAAIGSGRVVYFSTSNTVNVTNLQPNTTYFYKVVEANGPSGPVYDLANALTGSFTTGGAPTVAATNFTVSNQDGNRFRVSWTRGNGSQVLVVASLSPTFNGTGLPTNGTDYTANAQFSLGNPIGTDNFVVYEGTGTNVTVTGLLHSTTYYFRIFEFNGTLTNTVYNTTDFLSGNGSTLFPPTVGSTNLIATPTGNTASITWTRGNGSQSLVILQAGSVPGNPVDYTNYIDNSNFGSGSAIGSGYVVYFGTANTDNITNLTPNTTYFYKVVEANGTSGPVFNVATALTGSFTTAGAPTTGSSIFTTSNFQGNTFSMSFTPGNGSRRLVVMRQDLPVAWTPTDGIDYNVSSTFGSGDNLGSNTFAVADMTNSSVTINGLTPATTYHIAVFEFNGTATNTVYLTTPAQVLTGSASTISPPSVSTGNPLFTDINGHRGTVTFVAGNGSRRIVLVKAGSAVTDIPVNLVGYGSNSSFPSAPLLGTSRVVYNGTGTTFTLTSLQPNTTYHFAIFEYNGTSGPVYKQVDPGIGSFTTQGKPTTLPVNLTYSNLQGNRITLNYTTGNGFGRIVIAKAGAPVDAFPTDLTTYTASINFGTVGAHLGGGNYVIENNSAIDGNTSTSVQGLSIGQTYHFAIIEYNGTGTDRIYVTPAEALTGSQATLSAPTVQASNITFSGITATSATISWQNGDGTARIVLVRQGQSVTDLPVNLVNYTASSGWQFSPSIGTSRVVYDGTGSIVTVTGMDPAQYHVAVIEYNGTTGSVYRNIDPLTGTVVVGERPSQPASNITFSSIDGNSMTLNLSAGNGLSRMIVAKAGSPVDAWPVDNTGYSSGAFGTGSNLGNGNYVVSFGTGSSFPVSGLLPSTTYHFAVVEYNGSGASALYQLPSIVATASQSTLSAPTLATSSFFGTGITGNRMSLSWTNGNGAGRLIVAKAGSAVDVTPLDLVEYSQNTNFGSGTNLGGGNYAIFDGSGDISTLTNLQPATTYHFASFEYNGLSGGKVYLTSSIGRASFTTAPRPSVAPKNLSVSTVNGDRFNVGFTAGNGTRRLIVLRKGGLVNAVPTDLTTYSTGAFGGGTQIGTGNFAVALTTGAGPVTVTGLEPNTQYGVAVFELDGADGNERYLITEYINQLVSTSITPTIPTFSLLYNSIGSNSVNLSWTAGNGQGRMLVLRPFQPVTFKPTNLSTHGTSNINYTSAGILVVDHRHIQRGNNTTVTITNLAPGTTYHVAIFEYNGAGQPVYTSESLRGFFTTLPASGLAIGGFDAITFCPAQQVDVPYFFTGVLNTGNQLSIELSDITGSFTAPTVIGIQSTTNSTGFITSNLPAALPEGFGYRLRVRSTDPAFVSADNGADLQIATSVVPTVTIVGGSAISCGTPIQLTATQPNYNLQWFRNSVPIPQATTSSYFATTTGNYQARISGASGGCQLFSTGTSLTITPQPNFDLQFDSVFCDGAIQDFAGLALPAGGTFSGPGMTGSTFNSTTAGIGQHIITYTYTDAVSSCTFVTAKQVRVAALPAAPTTTGATGCNTTSVILTASSAQAGETYVWYTVASGGTAIAGATTANYVTPVLSATTTYYVATKNAACESARVAVTATILPAVTPPTAADVPRCGDGTVVLAASGSTNGNYRWYTQPTGGTAISGETNNTYTTPTLSATTPYYVSIHDGSCESSRTVVSSIVNVVPAAPTTTGNSGCPSTSITLSAAGGTNGQYRWYDVATGGTALSGQTNSTFNTPTLSATTDYYVSINNGTCESTRTIVTATISISGCNNSAPIIETTKLTTVVGGNVTINLQALISDADNNLDLSTLTIISPPASGAAASIDANFNLILDYTGVSFAGTESLTIRVCDFQSACTDQIINIQIAGEIQIYNALSPGTDGKNDVFLLQYIDLLESTKNNKVVIFNRWGDIVFDVENYNNTTRVFQGQSNDGKDLPTGVYFYRITFTGGEKTREGFISLKR